MMATSKDGWCKKSDAEILNSLRDWVLRCDLKYSKREALKKIDSCFCFVGGVEYVAAWCTCQMKMRCISRKRTGLIMLQELRF